MTQGEDILSKPVKAVCDKSATASPKSVLAQLYEEGIPDDKPVLYFEWVDEQVQIFLNRCQALEEVLE